jgi:hypothetical protein
VVRNALVVAIIVVAICAGVGVLVVLGSNSEKEVSGTIDTTDWKNFIDPFSDISILYPPTYKAEAAIVATDTPWATTELVTINDPSAPSSGEFSVPAIRVTLIRQPVLAGGVVYDSIEGYQRGVPQQLVNGATNPNGTIVKLDAGDALEFSFPAGDAADNAFEDYYIMHNGLIVEVTANAADPYKWEIVSHLSWQ